MEIERPMSQNPRNLNKDTPMVGEGTWRTLINRVDDLEKEVVLLKKDPTPPPQGIQDQISITNRILQDTRDCLTRQIDEAIRLKMITDRHQDLFPVLVRSIERLSKGHSAGNLGLPSKEDLEI